MDDLRDGMDRAVKRGVCESWLVRVSGFVAKEIVATDAAASAGFRKVGGVTLEVQDHHCRPYHARFHRFPEIKSTANNP